VRRLSLPVCLVTVITLFMAMPVLAATPGNDTWAGRTVIGTLPFEDTVDTTAATTDADDAEVNAGCGAPATDASVWYEFAAPADSAVLVDVSASSFPAGVAVVTGSPGSFASVTCGPGSVVFSAIEGQTYALLAFDDQTDGGGHGGTLVLSVETSPPPPTLEVTVDPRGQFDSHSGTATVHGTVTCTGDAPNTHLEIELRQRAGRVIISGHGFTSFPCDGSSHAWTVEVTPQNGLFKGGQATALTFAIACNPFECATDSQQAGVRLASS
jgi:uncharacterized protein DUF6299